MQSLSSQICIYVHVFCTIYRMWRGKAIELIGTAVNATCQDYLPMCRTFVSPGVAYMFMKMDVLVATILN
jgi:hypothetical protein